jgi:hypothetical protein
VTRRGTEGELHELIQNNSRWMQLRRAYYRAPEDNTPKRWLGVLRALAGMRPTPGLLREVADLGQEDFRFWKCEYYDAKGRKHSHIYAGPPEGPGGISARLITRPCRKHRAR